MVTPNGNMTSSYFPSLGIELVLSINATTLRVGQRLNASLSIVNTLPRVNTIQPSNNWLFQAVPVALWPPCYFGLPAEIAVLNGTYSAQNLRAAANATFKYICMEGVIVDHVIFQPASDKANLTGIYGVSGANQTLGPFHLSKSVTTSGYWNLQNLSKEINPPIIGDGANPKIPPDSIPFVPGSYTVAVEDEWGQIAILHFVVSP
jgi:hypothetical protein